MSDYSPLELFSENVPQMQRALMKLMHKPQVRSCRSDSGRETHRHGRFPE